MPHLGREVVERAVIVAVVAARRALGELEERRAEEDVAHDARRLADPHGEPREHLAVRARVERSIDPSIDPSEANKTKQNNEARDRRRTSFVSSAKPPHGGWNDACILRPIARGVEGRRRCLTPEDQEIKRWPGSLGRTSRNFGERHAHGLKRERGFALFWVSVNW